MLSGENVVQQTLDVYFLDAARGNSITLTNRLRPSFKEVLSLPVRTEEAVNINLAVWFEELRVRCFVRRTIYM